MNDTNYQNNDEIDLIELIKALWNKKIWILLSAFLGTTIAGVYAFTAKEQWTSTAIIVAPRSTDLGHLLPARAEYARIIGDSDFSTGGLSSSLYGQFKHFLLSNDLKRKFLEQSEWVKNYTKDMTEDQKRKYIEETVLKYLIVHEVDPKKKDLTELDKIGLKLTFSAETPKDAQSVLTEYVNFVNQYSLNQTNQEFKQEFNLRLDELRFSKEQIEENLTEAKKVQVENLTNALDIAKNTPVIYPANYYITDRQLFKLNKLASQLELVEDVKAYYYLSSPDFPVVKDNPKRALILAIGFIISILLPTFFILLGSVIQTNKKQS